jgi:hypothetical protein
LTSDILSDKAQIEIPRAIYEKIRQRVEANREEFQSVEEYIIFVLEEILREDEDDKKAYSPEEEKEVKKRLRNLGYL